MFDFLKLRKLGVKLAVSNDMFQLSNTRELLLSYIN